MPLGLPFKHWSVMMFIFHHPITGPRPKQVPNPMATRQLNLRVLLQDWRPRNRSQLAHRTTLRRNSGQISCVFTSNTQSWNGALTYLIILRCVVSLSSQTGVFKPQGGPATHQQRPKSPKEWVLREIVGERLSSGVFSFIAFPWPWFLVNSG